MQFVRVIFSLTMVAPSVSTSYDGMIHRNEVGRFMVQPVSCGSLTEEVLVQSEARPCGRFGGKSGTKTGFSFVTLVFPCQYQCTRAPYSFIYHKRYVILEIDSVVK